MRSTPRRPAWTWRRTGSWPHTWACLLYTSHKEIKVATGVQVYFCDPHAPWQRGSNENTNRLLRQFLPRSTDLNHYSRADLTQIARLLNDRPRKTLGFMKPSEKLAALVALTP